MSSQASGPGGTLDAQSHPADDRRARANVVRLAAAQALAGANAAVIFATGAVVGAGLAPDPSLATAPISVFVVGMAAGTLPAARIARTRGRRAAFVAGAGCGALSGLVAALAVWLGSFPLYCLAALLGGLYAAVVQSFRFAVADGASPAFRPRALSLVMAGGVFAGVLGPQLVTLTMDAGGPTFAVSYLAQALVALVAMAVLWGVDIPPPAPPSPGAGAGRPLLVVARRPRFVVAVLCGVVSYATMNLVMTSAPLAMRMCGLPLTASNLAIQWHIVAMYLPSFATGSLIARFGAGRVVGAGLLITLLAAATDLSGLSEAHFSAGLVLLGVGWNFGFVGASAMVLEALAGEAPAERARAQGLNDFLVFGTMAVGSFASGHLLTTRGWEAVNLVVLPPVALALLALLLGAALARRPRAARA